MLKKRFEQYIKDKKNLYYEAQSGCDDRSFLYHFNEGYYSALCELEGRLDDLFSGTSFNKDNEQEKEKFYKKDNKKDERLTFFRYKGSVCKLEELGLKPNKNVEVGDVYIVMNAPVTPGSDNISTKEYFCSSINPMIKWEELTEENVEKCYKRWKNKINQN